MSQLIRKCDACDHENSEMEYICTNCGRDISHIPAVIPGSKADKAHDNRADDDKDGLAPQEWVCPKCGAANQAHRILCTCGFDMSAVQPKTSRLILVAGKREMECKDGDILGRQGTVASDVFTGSNTVSRRHVVISQKDGRWFVVIPEDVKNVTQLDGRELPKGVPQELSGDHELTMSTKCMILLKVISG